MKNSLLLLVGIGMMFTNVSAQINEATFDRVASSWEDNIKVDASAKLDLRTKLASNDAKTQNEALKEYTVFDSANFSQVNFVSSNQDRPVTAWDTTNVRLLSLKLDKLSGDKKLEGQTMPFMAFSRDNTHPIFVFGHYELADDKKKDAVASNSSNNEESEPVSMLANKTQAKGQDDQKQQSSQGQEKELVVGDIRVVDGHSYTYMGKDVDGYPSWAPFNQTIVANPSKGNQQAMQNAIADTAKRTATYQMSVSQSGDPNLLASNFASGKAQKPEGSSGAMPEGIFELDPSKNYYHMVNGSPVLVDKPLSAMRVPRNAVVTNGNDVSLDARATTNKEIRHYYDLSTGSPTQASVEQVRWNNTVVATPVGGFYGGVGVYGSVHYGYNTRPQNQGGQNSCHYTGFQY
jgi:hypothetical protein